MAVLISRKVYVCGYHVSLLLRREWGGGGLLGIVLCNLDHDDEAFLSIDR